MATFTITTPVNFDSLTSKAGGDTYNINGGFLTIDGDTRYGLNAVAAGMGAVTPSATLGGTVSIDARYVRIIPYNSGSGNVPAYNTSISQGSASGVFIGAYSALNVAPTTPGSAMPASGFIKIKQWNSVAFSAGALTGIGATATGADRVGWIEVVGNEGPTNWTFSRLNNPTTPLVQGDWFEIGTTDGNRSTTYQIPSNGVNQYHGGVWVEGAASVAITGATYNTTDKRVTITATSHGFETGDKITISGVTPSGYNTTVYVRKLTANTFSYFLQEDPGTYTSGGAAAGNYEFYPVTSDTMTVANLPTTALKGKWCKLDTSTGLIRFGHDGTNSTGGYCPPTGRKIRIGNVFMTGATTGAPTQNSYNAAPASRPRFILSGAGRLDMRYASCNWGFGSVSNPQLVNLENVAIVDSFTPTNPATTMTFNNVGFGSPTAFAATRIVAQTVPEGATFTDVTIGISGQSTTANVNGINFTDVDGLELTRLKVWYSGAKGATKQLPINYSRTSNVSMLECIYSGALSGSSTSDVQILGGFSFDNTPTLNMVASALYHYGLSTASNNWLVEGVAIENGDLCRNGLLSSGSSSVNTVFRNIGSASSPISTGLWEQEDATWSRSTTVLTVTTSSAHGLTTGDSVMVYRTDASTAYARGLFTVTGTPTSTTFTFTCSNAGATSGVLSYYATQPARVFLLSTNSEVKMQNVNITGVRTTLYGLDNSSTSVDIENCYSDWRHDGAIAPASNNTNLFATTMTPISPTGNSSTYGTHIRSGYVADVTVPNATSATWTRGTTTATITKANHGLVTASRIMVLDSSNQAAFAGVGITNITVLTKDTFTMTVANTGTTSGTLDYVTADGHLSVDMNEPNVASADQYTIVAGTPLFTGAGSIAMPTVGDEAYWESPRFITDFDYAENMTCQMLGGTIANFDITYDLDTGSGFSGTWKNLWYQRSGGGGSSASTNVTMTDTTGVAVGDYIYGQGIAAGAKVQSITNSTTVVSTIANTGTVTGTLVFNQLPNATGLGSGFKIRVKVKTITANTGAITFIRLFFRSNSTTRATLYQQIELPYQTVTISGATAGSRIQLYDLTADEELYNGTPTFPYTWTDTDQYVADREIRLRVAYVNGATAKTFIDTTIGTATEEEPDITYLVNQENDEVYNDNAVDGSTVTDVDINDGTMRINVDTGSISWKDLYAYEMYWLFTSAGIEDYGQAIEAVDQANYRVTGMVIKNITSPSVPLELTGGWGVDSTTGKSIDLMDTTGGAIFNAPDHIVSFVGETSLTDADIDRIWDEPLSGHTTAGTAGKTLTDAKKKSNIAANK